MSETPKFIKYHIEQMGNISAIDEGGNLNYGISKSSLVHQANAAQMLYEALKLCEDADLASWLQKDIAAALKEVESL